MDKDRVVDCLAAGRNRGLDGVAGDLDGLDVLSGLEVPGRADRRVVLRPRDEILGAVSYGIDDRGLALRDQGSIPDVAELTDGSALRTSQADRRGTGRLVILNVR